MKCPDCGMSMHGSRCEECTNSYEVIAIVVMLLVILAGLIGLALK